MTDLKLDNIMVVPDAAIPGGERTKILDFGIAKLREPSLRLAETRGDLLLGTPGYMSPEQCRGAAGVDEKSDVYSLGVVMFRLLSGRMPFVAAGAGEIMAMHIYEDPPPLSGLAPWVPGPLSALVHRLLSKDKSERPTMRELVGLLDDLVGTLPDVTPPSRASVSSSEDNAAVTPSPDLDMGSDSPSVMPTVDSDDEEAPLRPGDAPPVALPSTLAASVGQQRTPLPRPRHRATQLLIPLAGGTLLVFVLLLLGRSLLLRPPSDLPMSSSQNPRPTADLGAASGAPKPAAAALAIVRWSVNTEPTGATVVRVSDGSVLGTTPWYAEVATGTGVEELRLRLSGYAEKLIQLDRGQDAVRHDVLDAVASGAAPSLPIEPALRETQPVPAVDKPRREGPRKKPRNVTIELED